MLERRRRNKHYDAVPGDELPEGEDGERDLELGEGVGVSQQETGRLDAGEVNAQAGEGAKRTATVSEELDNWDENVEDEWEEADADADGPSKAAKRAE
jgi:hypothetical protein